MSQIWFVTKLAQRILLGPTHPKFPTHTCSGWRQCRCEDGAERSPLGIRRQFLQRVSTAPGSSFSASSRGAARAGVAPSGYGPPRRAPTQPAGPWPLAHACGGGGWVDDSSSPHQGPQDLLAAVTLSHVALAHEVGMLLVPHMQRSLVWSQPLTPHWSPAHDYWMAASACWRHSCKYMSSRKGSPKSDWQ